MCIIYIITSYSSVPEKGTKASYFYFYLMVQNLLEYVWVASELAFIPKITSLHSSCPINLKDRTKASYYYFSLMLQNLQGKAWVALKLAFHTQKNFLQSSCPKKQLSLGVGRPVAHIYDSKFNYFLSSVFTARCVYN